MCISTAAGTSYSLCSADADNKPVRRKQTRVKKRIIPFPEPMCSILQGEREFCICDRQGGPGFPLEDSCSRECDRIAATEAREYRKKKQGPDRCRADVKYPRQNKAGGLRAFLNDTAKVA